MSERQHNVTLLPTPTIHPHETKVSKNRKEELGPLEPRIGFWAYRGARDASSYHEAYGPEIIAGRIKRDYDKTPEIMHDTQAELYHSGKIDTDKRAAQMCDFVEASTDPHDRPIIAVTVPIFAWNYFKSTLIKFEQQAKERKITKKPTIVVGGSWATFVPEEQIHEQFPELIIVKGDGAKVFSDIVGKVSRGEEVQKTIKAAPENLEDHSLPYRAFEKETRNNGGHIKLELSRGCEFNACKFCSRHVKPGEEGAYEIVPAEHAIAEIRDLLTSKETDPQRKQQEAQELLDYYTTTGLQLTDEDAFAGDVEATRRLVSAWKSADIPRIPFFASMRVEEVLRIHDADKETATDEGKILPQLREIGLQGIFLGVEGGSDKYLRQLGKGQTMTQVREAINVIKESVYIDPKTGEEEPLGVEFGSINPSPFMTWRMFVDNVRFLSEVEGQIIENDDDPREESDEVTKTFAQYVSALYNPEEVRAGTQNEKKLIGGQTAGGIQLLSYAERARDPRYRTHRDYHIYERFRDYDAQANFNINTLAYENVPYADPKVQACKEKADQFFDEDASLYYAIKSINRSHSLPSTQQQQAREFFLKMKQIHLQFLRDAAGLQIIDDLPQKRYKLIQQMEAMYGIEEQGDALDPVRREIRAFSLHEAERKQAANESDQIGVVLFCTDTKGRVLLARPREKDLWALPGGNPKPGETHEETGRRETKEELGVTDVKLYGKLGTITKEGHIDKTTGWRDTLTLHHYLAQLQGPIDLNNADHEIVDTLYLYPNQILRGDVETEENVRQMINDIYDQEKTRDHERREYVI